VSMWELFRPKLNANSFRYPDEYVFSGELGAFFYGNSTSQIVCNWSFWCLECTFKARDSRSYLIARGADSLSLARLC
jgi:hypothetical protein